MGSPPNFGVEELKLLRLIAERGPTTVREASDLYGVSAGVRLTTVGQMMERLRKKGALVREAAAGGFVYRSTADTDQLMGGVVRDFVDRSLGGSLSPFALYLAEKGKEIPENELAELRSIIERLSEGRDA
ncbi:MAG: BlaI/MecI/CopY family transcriptional regulator [Fimbriimonas sp.]